MSGITINKKKKESEQTVKIESCEIIIHSRFIFGRGWNTLKNRIDGERSFTILKIN